MSQDEENPLPTPAMETINTTIEPISTPNKESRKSRRRITKSPSMTIITVDDTGVSISSQSVREQTFNLWLEGKKDKQRSNPLVSSISSQSADVIINTGDIRETVFQNWLAEKEQNLVRRERMKRVELFERQKLVDAELSLRQNKSKTSFENWRKEKDSKKVVDMKRIAKEIRDKEMEETLKEENRQIEANLMYNAWTEQSDKKRVAIVKKQRQVILEKQRSKQELEESKRTEAEKMYNAWRIQKDALLRETAREKRDTEIKNQRIVVDKKKEQAAIAVRAYDAWLECKEEEKSSFTELNRILSPSLDGKWKPPGTYIPDYPRSSQTRDMDNLLDGRRGQLRVTTAKHSAIAGQPDH